MSNAACAGSNNEYETIRIKKGIFVMKIIEFTSDNPFSKHYTHGEVNESANAIGLYIGDQFRIAISYGRYLESIRVGKILCMAEYDAILTNRKNCTLNPLDVLSDYLTPMQTILKLKQHEWKTLGVFEYHYSKITIESREDELMYRVIEYRSDAPIRTHEFENLSLAKETFQNGVSNIIYYTSLTDLSCYMQQW